MPFTDDSELTLGFLAGDVTPLTEIHRTGWRILPFYVLVNHENVRGRVRQRGADYIVEDRHSYLVPRNEPHNLSWLEGENPLSIWCHFNLELHHGVDLLSLFEVPPEFAPPLSDALRGKCRELVQSPPGVTLRRKRLELELTALLLSGCGEREGAEAELAGLRRLGPALDYMKRHPGRSFRLEKAAAAVHLSVSRFSALFREVMGVPPYAWHQKLRLRRAYELLYTGSATPKEAAGELGFCDGFHFAKAFKQYCGVTPAALLKKLETEGRW